MKSQLAETKTHTLGKALAIQRELNERSTEETAAYLGIPSKDLRKIEKGEVSPSLPQLESLARYFNIPLDVLLSEKTEPKDASVDQNKVPAVIGLRNRIIALMLKRARVEQNMSLDDVSTTAGIEAGILEEYETGKVSIPLADLEEICSILGIAMRSLTTDAAKEPVVQKAETTTNTAEVMLQIPQELYEFVANNSNLPYLQLAKRLSEMDAAKLRTIAEGLLEITY